MQRTTRIMFTVVQLLITIVTDVETLEITMTTNNEHVSSISAGSNVTLHCSTTEPVELKEVQWRKDRKGFTITNARVNTERDSNGTIVSSDLHLLNVSTKRTNGLYECLSWTKTSKNVSASYSLHVDEPPAIQIQLFPNDVYFGSQVELTCEDTMGWPKPAVHWLTPDGEIIRSKIHTIKAHYQDIYVCVAVNQVGRVNESVTIIPRGKKSLSIDKQKGVMPQILAPNRTVIGYINGNVSITIETEINSEIEDVIISWSFNGRSLEESNKYKTKHQISPWTMDVFTLLIKDLTVNDSGKYTLQISTDEPPSTKKYVFLQVEDLPKAFAKNSSHGSLKDSSSNISKTTLPLIITLVLVSTSLLILLGILSLIVLKRMFKRKYRYFKGIKCDNQQPHKYDLFISYTRSDFDWVRNKLIPLLEKHQVTYCIHCKDFEIGKTIVDNMADSVYLSKHIMIILSDRYTESAFCRCELDMAVCRSKVNKKPVLTVINLGCSAMKSLKKLNKNNVYFHSLENKQSDTWQDNMVKQLQLAIDESV